MNLKECLRLAKDAGFDGIELNYDLLTTSLMRSTEILASRRNPNRV